MVTSRELDSAKDLWKDKSGHQEKGNIRVGSFVEILGHKREIFQLDTLVHGMLSSTNCDIIPKDLKS